MSANETESGEPTEKEPITEEGKAKSESKEAQRQRQSLRVKIIAAREESRGKVGFLGAVIALIIGSVVGLIAIAITDIIHIIQIVIGAIYIHDCRLRPGIPIILIVYGSVVILGSIVEGLNKGYERRSKARGTGPPKSLVLTVINNIVRMAVFGAFIAWCILVYGSGSPNFDNTESDNYCHSTLYLFAFWLLNIYVALMAIFLFCCCCCCCFAKKADDV